MTISYRRSGNAALLSFGLALAPAVVHGQTFGYFGDNGPSHWAELDAGWEACGTGGLQSPVDFGKLHVANPTTFLTLEYEATAGEIFHNGHTIEVEVVEGINILKLRGVEYELVQFHFHTASEHTVRNRGYDMEMHLVHRSAAGVNAVLGVFLRRGPSSGALAPIFESLPDDVHVKHELDELFDPATFLPRRRRNYRYTGSLTTPPCTEGVHWAVLANPVTISDEHLAQFAERIHFNARQVQRELP
jgi:carbonic anhydrase